MRSKNRGFTLIELIVVIAILGVLGAVALPRFISAQQDARIAKAQALFGSLRSAAALAKSRCELDLARGLTGAGQCGNAAPQVTMDGQTVDIANSYPAATANGIDRAGQVDLANDGYTAVAGGTIGVCTGRVFRVAGAAGTTAGANTCAVCYEAAVANSAPDITINVSNC